MLGTTQRIFQRRLDLRKNLLDHNLIATLCDVVASATEHELDSEAPQDDISEPASANDSFVDVNLSMQQVCLPLKFFSHWIGGGSRWHHVNCYSNGD